LIFAQFICIPEHRNACFWVSFCHKPPHWTICGSNESWTPTWRQYISNYIAILRTDVCIWRTNFRWMFC
jgi:hypothetical protein